MTNVNWTRRQVGVAGMVTSTKMRTSISSSLIATQARARGSRKATELVSKAMKIRQSRMLNEELLERSLSWGHSNLITTDDTLLQDLFQFKMSELIEEEEVQGNNALDESGELGTSMLDRVKQMEIAPLSKRHLDVPDAELHLQMEAARKRAQPLTAAENFVHNSGSAAACALIETVACDDDTTTAEKFAMRVIPLQLPGPVAKAVANQVEFASTRLVRNVSETSVTTKLIHGRNARKKTLSTEEELCLINIMHKGAKIKSLKAEYEGKTGKTLSFKEWATYAMTSEDELRNLMAQYRDAKSTLVVANMGLVHAVVSNLYRSLRGDLNVDREMDLVQEGFMGLIRAAELFDPSRVFALVLMQLSGSRGY